MSSHAKDLAVYVESSLYLDDVYISSSAPPRDMKIIEKLLTMIAVLMIRYIIV